jgi:glycosyltransferase involved in cell wall biosynthesis
VGLSSRQIRNLPKRIIGIRHLSSPADLAELYSTVDVFVNPTLEDNFPTTNLEALACGTPVVTFQTGGSPESIDERTGLVARRGDIDDLFAKILQIRQNGKAAYSAACRARAEAMFRREERYQQYIDLYGAVLDGVQKRQTGISERNREL